MMVIAIPNIEGIRTVKERLTVNTCRFTMFGFQILLVMRMFSFAVTISYMRV